MNWLTYIDLNTIEYGQAWKFQEEKLQVVIENRNSKKQSGAGFVLFCEHPHVYTLGKSGQQNNLLIQPEFLEKINATYYQSNRGGDITYHGPGQLVGYPIIDLNKFKIGVKDYVYKLEACIILLLAKYNLEASRLDGATGVWLDVGTPNARKICAIGVRVSRSVTMHGFALNVNTDLNYFNYINPCGFQDKGVTSLQKEKREKINFEILKEQLLDIFQNEFKFSVL